MPDIVSIGECMLELFSEEPMGEAETFTRSLAGDSLNILVAAQRLGSSTGYITRLGDDPFAEYLQGAWRNEGIDASRVKVVDGFNAVHFVSLLPGGDRKFTYYRKGSAPSTMQPSDLDHDYIGDARILHVSGIGQAISTTARATILEAVRIADDRGVSVSYDPSYRHQLWTPANLWPSTLIPSSGKSHILPHNAHHSADVSGSASFSNLNGTFTDFRFTCNVIRTWALFGTGFSALST